MAGAGAMSVAKYARNSRMFFADRQRYLDWDPHILRVS